MKKKNQYNDPLSVQNSFAQPLGTLSQKLDYDPQFGRKFYAGMYLFFAAILAVIGAASQVVSFYYAAAGFVFLGIVTFLFYGFWKSYDIASTRVYCEKLYPPGTSKAKIRECIYSRERNEDVMGSVGSSGVSLALGVGTFLNDR